MRIFHLPVGTTDLFMILADDAVTVGMSDPSDGTDSWAMVEERPAEVLARLGRHDHNLEEVGL